MGVPIRVLPIALVLLLVPAAALSSALYLAPEVVQADGDGKFRFTVVLVAGEGCVGWTGYGYGGEENIEGGMYADTFCLDPQPIAPGEELSFEVRGQLTDPTLPGIAWSESAFCEGGGGWAYTTVLAPAVDNDQTGWSALKGRYR